MVFGTEEHAALAALKRSVSFIDHIIQDGRLNGKKIRMTDEPNPRMAASDCLQLLGMNSNQAHLYISRHKDVLSFLTKLKFSGKGQREIHVVDGPGLIRLLSKFTGKKYKQFADEINALQSYVTARFLGGSQTLQQVSNAIAEQAEKQPGTVLGALRDEAKREDAAVRELEKKRQKLLDDMEFYQRRVDAAEMTKATNEAIREKNPHLDRTFYMRKNQIITEAVTGRLPGELKVEMGFPKDDKNISARSLMGKATLGGTTMLEAIATDLFQNNEGNPVEALDTLQKLSDSMELLRSCMSGQVHNHPVTPAAARRGVKRTRAQLDQLPDAPEVPQIANS